MSIFTLVPFSLSSQAGTPSQPTLSRSPSVLARHITLGSSSQRLRTIRITLLHLAKHDHPKIAKVLRLSAHRTAHFIDIMRVADVDRDVRGWLAEAYACSPV
jgi:hypothetical protein